MSLTLLLDLDNTLLENDIDKFLSYYLKAFSKEVVKYQIDPNQFVNYLLKGSQAMVENQKPDVTLRETFNTVFFPALNLDPEQFQPVADHFYAQVFPQLRGLTRPIPEAVILVEEAVRRNYRLAIATNPLFPESAILQRLDWANLPPDRIAYELITSYETFHFAKPNPAYFAEILARLGWPSGNVLFAGDNLERDIIPAHEMGLVTYWVDSISRTTSKIVASACGSLEKILAWIDRSTEDELLPNYSSATARQAVLRSTPAYIDTLHRQFPADRWTISTTEDEWCLKEVVCHLRDVEIEVNLPRIQKVIKEKNPYFTGTDTDRWAKERNYLLQDSKEAFHSFLEARMESLKLLQSLAETDWTRSARHTIFGPTNLAELVEIMAAHDRLHVQQMHQLIQ